MGDDGSECPICASQLKVQGDVLRSFGEPSNDAVSFGSDVIALECGHRMHRSCLVQWLNTTLSPTCPMCRTLTQWKPTLQEEKRISRMIETSWKVLSRPEQTIVKLSWIVAACVAITDPIGFFLVASVLMLLTPPILYAEMAIFLAYIKPFIVGKQPAGFRILMAAGVATIITAVTVANHEVLEMN